MHPIILWAMMGQVVIRPEVGSTLCLEVRRRRGRAQSVYVLSSCGGRTRWQLGQRLDPRFVWREVDVEAEYRRCVSHLVGDGPVVD